MVLTGIVMAVSVSEQGWPPAASALPFLQLSLSTLLLKSTPGSVTRPGSGGKEKYRAPTPFLLESACPLPSKALCSPTRKLHRVLLPRFLIGVSLHGGH